MPVVEIIAICGAAISVATSLVALLRVPRDVRREDRKQRAEEDKSFADEARKLLEEKIELLERERALKEAIKAANTKIKSLEESVQRLERLVPLALISGRWTPDSDLGYVLDQSQDLFAITSSANGGTFLWVNLAWEKQLGWTRDDLQGVNWKSIVHPQDLRITERTESTTWGDNASVVNRYRTKSGQWATLRWFASKYLEGVTLALARVEQVV